MRRILVLVALLAAGFATPAAAQDSQADCMAQMAATVRPLLERASQFSPQGVAGQGFVPLAQPFAPGGYLLGGGAFPPGPPTYAPPTAAYNLSSNYTGRVALGQPNFTSQGLTQYLVQNGVINPFNPTAGSGGLMIALANLGQTEQARQQQQALLQQQQGLYLNSLYQLSSSYQVTSLDWQEAYSGLAQAWMSYYRDLCANGGSSAATTPAPPPAPVGMSQPFPTYPAGNAPLVPPYPGVPGMAMR